MRVRPHLLFLAAVAASVAGSAHARVDDGDRVVIPRSVHPLARAEHDVGPTDPSTPLEHAILAFRIAPEKQAQLEAVLAAQHDPASPWFHRWLTPGEFADRFGPSPGDVAEATAWLESHRLQIDEVARSRMWLDFSGLVPAVERAFRTQMRNYRVDGRLHHANASDPSVPRALARSVAGVVSLHDFRHRALHSDAQAVSPTYTSGTSHYLSPGDFGTVYDVLPLWSAGIDGAGQSIAVVGRTHPPQTAWATFRGLMGLPPNPPQVVVNGPDPGDLGADEDMEADLDVEWAGAVARRATILFVTSKGTATTDGVDLSARYVVDHDLAPVMTTSFGACEAALTSAGTTFYRNLWAQAAAQGITAVVSSGDSGAAGCNVGADGFGAGRAVNGLASTPYDVAVGGTQLAEGGGTYWSVSNGSGYASALRYVPEVAWNESGLVSGGSGLWATGGGASAVHAKPSWQVAPGVPADGARDIPDVSLSAAKHDAYLVYTGGSLVAIAGTSASTPAFAGLMALVVQSAGQRQGNANVRLYQLATAQWTSGGPAVFHDTTGGNNAVPGTAGFTAGGGYDQATGLGSVDAAVLVGAWDGGTSTVSDAGVGAPALNGLHVVLGAGMLALAGAGLVRPGRKG
jgi:subtilase family serine protease